MRPALKKVLWKEASAEFARRAPEFAERKGEKLPPVCRLYGRRVTEGLTLFAMVQVDRYEDEFTIEVGWSRDDRWPDTFKAQPPTPAQSAELESARVRLRRLRGIQNVWWKVHDEASVRTALKEAVDEFVADGLPYLEAIAAALTSRG